MKWKKRERVQLITVETKFYNFLQKVAVRCIEGVLTLAHYNEADNRTVGLLDTRKGVILLAYINPLIR